MILMECTGLAVNGSPGLGRNDMKQSIIITNEMVNVYSFAITRKTTTTTTTVE